VSAATAALELLSIHLGRRLGLYQAVTVPRTPGELAAAAGIHERYAREWLEQQAVAGLVDVAAPSPKWDERSYVLTDHHTAVLIDPEHPAHVAPLADMFAGIAGVLDDVAAAYRTGGGVPYAEYGTIFRNGQAGINRPAFTHDLVSWLQAVPDVAARLAEGGKLADLGCGAGWSTIALATALPHTEVIGYDSDPASIADAAANAAERGVDVAFELADASALEAHGPFDLVVILEALHDMARPAEVLAAARRALASDGAVLVADEKVADEFTSQGDELERMMYGWSIVHCLPAALAESPSAAIGTVIRPAMVEALAAEAGFSAVHVSDIDAGFFRLYGLRV
jgi:2-polyprenyl-3-methyl-5-hydroxy-6-metoxy-1,4-benzoquinol methylase